MGAKHSVSSSANSPRVRTLSTGVNNDNDPTAGSAMTTTSGPDARQRARSLGTLGPNMTYHQGGQPIPIPNVAYSADSDDDASTPDEGLVGRVFAAHSLPTQLWSFNGIKCPVCSKFVLPDDIEFHLVVCLTKPCITYNDDVLTDDKGECVICLDDLKQGDTIARLPCLCIYHKSCIDSWFEVNRSCPEHPLD